MNPGFEESFLKLKSYCEKEKFKGGDPFDGLTSSLFNSIPFLNKNRLARLSWIQLFKRSPVNLRPFVGIPKKYNAKGVALFLTGYCNLYHNDQNEDHLEKIFFLADTLLDLQNKDFSGSCWGYYFHWQARAFFQPANTPTVVATSFVHDALLNAYEITKKEEFLQTALSAADFVLKDLNRTYDESGDFCFSYSPLDNTQVFNASLLGAKLLSRTYNYTKDEKHKQEAQKAVAYVCTRQNSDGSWKYGNLPYHNWIDNFHTGFNLECLYDYKRYTSDNAYDQNFDKGFQFYINHFFDEDGTAKYYHNKTYPIDIHSPAQLMVTLVKTNNFEKHSSLADKVLQWTITHMQNSEGYFYYQKKKGSISKIPYMRWAQAWMFYAFSYYKLKSL